MACSNCRDLSIMSPSVFTCSQTMRFKKHSHEGKILPCCLNHQTRQTAEEPRPADRTVARKAPLNRAVENLLEGFDMQEGEQWEPPSGRIPHTCLTLNWLLTNLSRCFSLMQETSFPPKAKDAPAGRLSQLGTLLTAPAPKVHHVPSE